MRKHLAVVIAFSVLAGLAISRICLQPAQAQNATGAVFNQSRGLYLTGSAAANTGGTNTTITLGGIGTTSDSNSTIFDAQLVTLSVTNPTASGQAITAIQLQFTDTIGGVASTQSYGAVLPATLAAGANGVYSIPITQGALKNVQVVVTFAANPSASTVSVAASFSANQPVPVPYDALEVASAARTSGYIGPTHTQLTGHKGILVCMNITAASGSGGLQLTLENLDPVSGQWAQSNSTPTAVTTTGLQKLEIYPGAASTNPGATQTSSGPLGRNWRIHVFAGDSTSYTYSIGYTLLP
jgi:hypothetical protein